MKTWLKTMIGWGLAVDVLLSIMLKFFDVSLPEAWWLVLGAWFFGLFLYYTIRQNLSVYVLKRIFGAFTTLFVIASVTFLLLRVLPGGPFDQEKALPPEVKANIEAKYHLDKPVIVQYLYYMEHLAQGDLGESFKYLGRPITDIIFQTLPVSFALGLYSLVLAFLLGIPAGLYAASRQNTPSDHLTMLAAISGVSLPSFLMAPILILIFCFYLGWVPPALWDGPQYYILPVITLGIRPAAIIARLTRASVLDVIHSDYVRTAESKGLSRANVLFKHVLKNALIPVLTFSGPLVAGVLSGSFIIEVIFAIPGLGIHLVHSVTDRDYPLIMGTTLVFAVLLIGANLLVDLLYSYFDPRIKLS